MRNFRDILKISGMNVSRLDTYPEKNNLDFRKVIFGVKKCFAENRVFSIFAKNSDEKICIFGNERYSLKNEPHFLTSSPWKSNENYGRKNLFMENGNKIVTRTISS